MHFARRRGVCSSSSEHLKKGVYVNVVLIVMQIEDFYRGTMYHYLKVIVRLDIQVVRFHCHLSVSGHHITCLSLNLHLQSPKYDRRELARNVATCKMFRLVWCVDG